MTIIENPLGRLAGGRPNVCEAGHGLHATQEVDVALGEVHLVPDYPAIPERLATKFKLNVYDAPRYQGTTGYCTADDEFSRSLLVNQCWEGFETLIALEFLALDGPGCVLDFGAHVGWYSILAAMWRRPVFAVDADAENLSLLRDSAAVNGVDPLITTIRGWVNEDSPVLEPFGPVRFLKADVEGAEADVIRVCQPLLTAGLVDAVLIEASPMFGDGWRDAVRMLELARMSARLVPEKGCDLHAFERNPIGSMRPLTAGDLRGALDRYSQRSLLFLRNDL